MVVIGLYGVSVRSSASEIAVAWPVVRGPVLRVGTTRAWPGCLRAAVLRPG